MIFYTLLGLQIGFFVLMFVELYWNQDATKQALIFDINNKTTTEPQNMFVVFLVTLLSSVRRSILFWILYALFVYGHLVFLSDAMLPSTGQIFGDIEEAFEKEFLRMVVGLLIVNIPLWGYWIAYGQKKYLQNTFREHDQQCLEKMRHTFFWVVAEKDYLHFPYEDQLQSLIKDIKPYKKHHPYLTEYLHTLSMLIAKMKKKPSAVLKKKDVVVSVFVPHMEQDRFIFIHRWGLKLWNIYIHAPNLIKEPKKIDEAHVTDYLKEYKELTLSFLPQRHHPILNLFELVEKIFQLTPK